jgi:hypothetical protein
MVGPGTYKPTRGVFVTFSLAALASFASPASLASPALWSIWLSLPRHLHYNKYLGWTERRIDPGVCRGDYKQGPRSKPPDIHSIVTPRKISHACTTSPQLTTCLTHTRNIQVVAEKNWVVHHPETTLSTLSAWHQNTFAAVSAGGNGSNNHKNRPL